MRDRAHLRGQHDALYIDSGDGEPDQYGVGYSYNDININIDSASGVAP